MAQGYGLRAFNSLELSWLEIHIPVQIYLSMFYEWYSVNGIRMIVVRLMLNTAWYHFGKDFVNKFETGITGCQRNQIVIRYETGLCSRGKRTGA